MLLQCLPSLLFGKVLGHELANMFHMASSLLTMFVGDARSLHSQHFTLASAVHLAKTVNNSHRDRHNGIVMKKLRLMTILLYHSDMHNVKSPLHFSWCSDMQGGCLTHAKSYTDT